MIRKANSADIPNLTLLNKTAQKEQGWWIPQTLLFYKKFLKNKNNAIYVAIEKNKIVGFLTLEYNKHRKSTWINDIYVIPTARKKGIAKSLLKSALLEWKTKSQSIVLLTSNRNVPIFQKLGFKKTMNFMEFKTSRKKQTF